MGNNLFAVQVVLLELSLTLTIELANRFFLFLPSKVVRLKISS